jgi:hypothetical protein
MRLPFSRLVLCLAIVTACACQQASDPKMEAKVAEPPNVFPARAAALLRNADTLQVLRLMPEQDERSTNAFHGYPIQDTVIVEATAQKAFVEAIVAGVAPTSTLHPCFLPHHGIHAVSEGESVDLIICLLCSRTQVYYSDGKMDGFSPSDRISKTLSEPFGGKS